MVRSALKEPMKSKAKSRDAVYFRSAQWENGKPIKQGTCGLLGCNSCRCLWLLREGVCEGYMAVPASYHVHTTQ